MACGEHLEPYGGRGLAAPQVRKKMADHDGGVVRVDGHLGTVQRVGKGEGGGEGAQSMWTGYAGHTKARLDRRQNHAPYIAPLWMQAREPPSHPGAHLACVPWSGYRLQKRVSRYGAQHVMRLNLLLCPRHLPIYLGMCTSRPALQSDQRACVPTPAQTEVKCRGRCLRQWLQKMWAWREAGLGWGGVRGAAFYGAPAAFREHTLFL